VSATKLRRAQGRAEKGGPYADKMGEVLANLVGSLPPGAKVEHPLMEVRPEVRTVLLVPVASDKGLAGSFNSNVAREVRLQVARWEGQGVQVRLLPIGKKIREMLKRDPRVVDSFAGLDQNIPIGELRTITDRLVGLFTGGEVDRVDFIYTRFLSAATQRVVSEQFLPLSREAETDAAPKTREYLFEPDPQSLFISLLPAYARVKVFFVLAQNFASEHAARMVSMRNATDNAGELIKSLTLQRNKARQAAITKELAEIVGGAEALKG
ncbi:MAG TPA: ATP synthase F1 subunit gamma, partial [bacterium]|nr:ATP synthase F1 subunit gamma [bacterium]